jgi:CRISPR/Cas system-associated endonuclease Cas3-HD
MDKSKLSHDILNILERLRIMHDLIKEQNYQHIPKDELMKDLQENLDLLKKNFDTFSTDQ